MKNLGSLLIIIVLAFSFTSVNALQPYNMGHIPEDKKPKYTVVRLYIIFGNKKNVDCSGIGLCDIYLAPPATGPQTITGEGSSLGTGYLDKEGRFIIEFDKESMTAETINTYFVGSFKLEETYSIPGKVLKKLNSTDNYNISTGIYQFHEVNDKIIVRF